MKLVYEKKIYDYKTKEEAIEHAEKMNKKGWLINDMYEYQNGEYKWTVEYHK